MNLKVNRSYPGPHSEVSKDFFLTASSCVCGCWKDCLTVGTPSHPEAQSASPRSFQAKSRSIHQQMLAVFRLNCDGLVLQQASELSSNFHGRLCNDCEVEVAMGLVSLALLLVSR